MAILLALLGILLITVILSRPQRFKKLQLINKLIFALHTIAVYLLCFIVLGQYDVGVEIDSPGHSTILAVTATLYATVAVAAAYPLLVAILPEVRRLVSALLLRGADWIGCRRQVRWDRGLPSLEIVEVREMEE